MRLTTIMKSTHGLLTFRGQGERGIGKCDLLPSRSKTTTSIS